MKMTVESMGNKGTFSLNKNKPFYSWYQYVEGYSEELVESEIQRLGDVKSVFDPFCGSGTTMIYSSLNGIKSYYTETNPLMCWITKVKTDSARKAFIELDEVIDTYSEILKKLDKIEDFYDTLPNDGFRKYYDEPVLRNIYAIKKIILSSSKKEYITDCFMIALISNVVKVSKMIKNGDLRYATEKEYSKKNKDIVSLFVEKANCVIDDLKQHGQELKEDSEFLCYDARDVENENLVDCIITSPPYLNGTNYIRNTKLELNILGYINDESELPRYHSKGIIAGINNVSNRALVINNKFDFVQSIIDELLPITYDSRIPKMIEGYFDNMYVVFEKMSRILKDGGMLSLDIGDSQFSGIHIKTHELLEKIASFVGFIKIDEEVLRKRKSHGGMELSQRIMRFRLDKSHIIKDEYANFKNLAQKFIDEMPYKKEPYNGRNWGHEWHSLCSYHGKLKPAIAHFLISNFTKPNDIVLDPLCGVGTIPFEACLQGRKGIGNDLSEMAYVVTKAKLSKPSLEDVNSVLSALELYIEENKSSNLIAEEKEKYATFGFNGKISEYFHSDTYGEILCARKYFVDKLKHISSAESLVFACFLHVLHGNRPYALSRNSHPLTPYAPKGEFVYKNVLSHIRDKINLSYRKGDFDSYIFGKAIYGDFSELSNYDFLADCIITSPPFADSIKFYMQNWMRLWLCGWEIKDFKEAEEKFLDQKQKKNFDIYDGFFEMCFKKLKPRGRLILHLGRTDKVDMAEELSLKATKYFDEVYRASENVSEIEKHGIKDKGGTFEHQYLFLMKK